MSQNNINDFLSINLTEFAISHGYTQKIAHKSSKKWLALKNPKSNDKIIITDKGYGGHPFYMNLDQSLSLDKGNIINFVINRMQNRVHPITNPSKIEFAKAFASLAQHNGSILNLDELEKTKKNQEKEYLLKVKSKLKNLKPLNEIGYNYLLEQRGISKETLQHPMFLNTVKQSPVAMNNGKIIENIALLKSDGTKTTGITVHYFSSKFKKNQKMVYELQDSVCLSNIPHTIHEILYFETAIDAFSYFQLHPNQNYQNSVFFSFEGNISNAKMKIFKRLLNNAQQKKIISHTDNDKPGYRYDLKIAIQLYNNSNPLKPIEIIQAQEKTILKLFNFNDSPIISDKASQIIKADFELKQNQQNKHLFNIIQLKEHMLIEFPNKTDNSSFLNPITEAIHNQNNILFENKKTVFDNQIAFKDWNEVLLASQSEGFKKKILKDYPNAIQIKTNQGYYIASHQNPQIAINISKKHLNEFNHNSFLSWKNAAQNIQTQKKNKGVKI